MTGKNLPIANKGAGYIIQVGVAGTILKTAINASVPFSDLFYYALLKPAGHVMQTDRADPVFIMPGQ